MILCDLVWGPGNGPDSGLSFTLLGFALVLLGVVGALLGTALGVGLISAFVLGAEAEESRVLDRMDRALLPSALTLLLVVGPVSLLAPVTSPWCIVICSGAVVVALVMFGLLAVRDVRRLRWLGRLFRGELESYRLVPGAFDVTPLFGGTDEGLAMGHICFVPPPEPPPKAPYREKAPAAAPDPVVVARVPMALRAARRPFLLRLVLTTCAIGLALFITALRLRALW
ncbi:MAG: hypothetical protein U0441_12200 [Polyangiaceae bacterium]